MADSTFREALSFLDSIGVFDVVLPFLLIFTITFAMLEKSKIFGTEVVDGKHYTKKNLNSLASFAIAFFAVASSWVVQTLTQISANVVVLLFASVFFLMLVSSFSQQADEKGFALGGTWQKVFMVIMFAGLAGIFLNAMETDGRTWLQWSLGWLSDISANIPVAATVLIVGIIAAMVYITRGEKPPEKK